MITLITDHTDYRLVCCYFTDYHSKTKAVSGNLLHTLGHCEHQAMDVLYLFGYKTGFLFSRMTTNN